MDSLLKREFDEETQREWEEVCKQTGLNEESIPREMLAVVKAYFCLAYEKGQEHIIANMREIFNNDPCLFEEYFDNSEDD